MATIWFLKEGEIQSGPPIEEKSLDWCIKNLGLRSDNWLTDLPTKNLTVGEKSKTGLGPYRGFRFVLVEVDQDDLGTSSITEEWKTGFRLLNMDATEARIVLEQSTR
jgi:hypothetical protein